MTHVSLAELEAAARDERDSRPHTVPMQSRANVGECDECGEYRPLDQYDLCHRCAVANQQTYYFDNDYRN